MPGNTLQKLRGQSIDMQNMGVSCEKMHYHHIVKYVGRSLSKIHFERKHTKNDIKAKPTKKASSYRDAVTYVYAFLPETSGLTKTIIYKSGNEFP